MMRRLVYIIVAVVIAAISFWATLAVMDYNDSASRDKQRAADAQVLKAALERYRAARGKYPAPFGDNSVFDLKAELVGGGFLQAIPDDPLWAGSERQYRYVSGDGLKYGLFFHLENKSGAILAGGGCITGVGTAGTGWWGLPPDCPF